MSWTSDIPSLSNVISTSITQIQNNFTEISTKLLDQATLTTALTVNTGAVTIAGSAAGARQLTLTRNLTSQGSYGTILASEAQENTITLHESITVGGGDSSAVLTMEDSLTVSGGADIILSAVGSARTLTLNESLTIGDGNDGTITFGAASKTLTVSESATINQNVSTTSDVTFGSVTATGTVSSNQLVMSNGASDGAVLVSDTAGSGSWSTSYHSDYYINNFMQGYRMERLSDTQVKITFPGCPSWTAVTGTHASLGNNTLYKVGIHKSITAAPANNNIQIATSLSGTHKFIGCFFTDGSGDIEPFWMPHQNKHLYDEKIAHASWTGENDSMTEDTWYNVDCSSYIPKGDVEFAIVVIQHKRSAKSQMNVRRNGSSSSGWELYATGQSENDRGTAVVSVPVDANGVFEMRVTDNSADWCNVWILGWEGRT